MCRSISSPSECRVSSGWCVSTKIGPRQAPPYGRASPIALSKPARPARTEPVVVTYSWIKPGRKSKPVSQLMSWSGPATKPSRDIVKCQSTFPEAVWGVKSSMPHQT